MSRHDKHDEDYIEHEQDYEEHEGDFEKYKPRSRQTVAYILFGVAGFIILSSTGWLDLLGISSLIGFAFRTVYSLIPAACVALGALWLYRADDGERPIAAWFLVMFGGALLIAQFELFGLSFGNLFFPIVLVCVALTLINPGDILPRGAGFSRRRGAKGEADTDADTKAGKKTPRSIRLFAFMGGGEVKYSSQFLNGGEIGAFMGGYQVDLTDAEMEGDEMVLDVFYVMGGCEIIVPPNWEVEKQAIAIMGGFSNKTRCLAEKLDLPRKKLIIKGIAFMGGGEVKN